MRGRVAYLEPLKHLEGPSFSFPPPLVFCGFVWIVSPYPSLQIFEDDVCRRSFHLLECIAFELRRLQCRVINTMWCHRLTAEHVKASHNPKGKNVEDQP
jgi:hypothetical protein